MADVVVVVPVLGRPHRVAPLVESLLRAQVRVETRILFVVSPGAERVDELHEIKRAGADYVIALWQPGPGDYARKINLGARLSTEPWIFTGADDLAFRAGWADAAIECAGFGFGVVGTNDLSNATVMRGEHSTHSLIRRTYMKAFGTIDQPGLIYHEGYDHQWCDTELVATAIKRGTWVWCGESLVEHLHPFVGKSQLDPTYEKGLAHGRDDRRLFESRKPLWV